MTQINWEMLKGPNRTKLGTFHPGFGTYIPPEYKTEVKIQGKSTPHPLSSLLIEAAFNESVQICCAFVTFPSGKLEQCTDISEKEPNINTMTKGIVILTHSVLHMRNYLRTINLVFLRHIEFSHMKSEPGMGFFGSLGAMIIGSILSLITLVMLFFLCRKCNYKR